MPKSRKRKFPAGARQGEDQPAQPARPQAYRSPATGDLGFSEHPWFRMDDAALGLDLPTVAFDLRELLINGYHPDDLGMTRVGSHDAPFEIPEMAALADMKSRYDIDLYEPDPVDMNNPKMIIGGVFADRHPDEWWDRIHGEQSLVVMAADTPQLARASGQAGSSVPFDLVTFVDQSYIGRVRGLMIRAYKTGIGTQMPGA